MKSAFVTWTNNVLLSSDEFRQCLHLLLQSIPDSIDVHVLTTDDDRTPLVSDLDRVPHLNSYEVLFIAASPDFITPQDSFMIMTNIIREQETIDCLLPVAFNDLPERDTAAFPYYTLRGFERYAQSLKYSLPLLAAHINPNTPFFLMRSSALRELSPQTSISDITNKMDPTKIKSTCHAFFHSFSGYYSEQRVDIFRLLPKGVFSVLDIGCASGYFGKYVREKTGCRVVGIEINLQKAQRAEKYLDRVITGDFLAVNIDETFDCISCLDVIEHIRYPDRFLEKAVKLLNDRGYLLCSIPNIGHWSIVADLLAGRFDYVPAGILSVSHLHFFTEKTARSLIENAGFDILFVEAQKTPLPAQIAKCFHSLEQHDMEIDQENLSSLGYYILAQKKCNY